MDKQFVLFPKKKTNTWDNAKEDSPKYMKKFWLSKFWKLTKYLSSLPPTTSTDTDNNEVAIGCAAQRFRTCTETKLKRLTAGRTILAG
jgi:hypothetical protein